MTILVALYITGKKNRKKVLDWSFLGFFCRKMSLDKNSASFAKEYPKNPRELCGKIQLMNNVTYLHGRNVSVSCRHKYKRRNVTNERDNQL